MRWFPVAFLINGVFIETRVGFELTTPVFVSPHTKSPRVKTAKEYVIGHQNHVYFHRFCEGCIEPYH